MAEVLSIDGVSKAFPIRRDFLGRVTMRLHALSDVTLGVSAHRTLGLVGESGSGKSTLARVAMRLERPDRGTVRLHGEDITSSSGAHLQQVRRKMHMVFQDPRSSLNPNWVVRELIAEPLRGQTNLSAQARNDRVLELLDDVGLRPDHANCYVHEFSGGQRQRIAIARSLALEPDLVVCDEAVSALDVSTQAQILSLLERLQDEQGLAFLFIAHDLAVVHHISDEIAVMYLGRIAERGPAAEVYERPRHPYTEALLSAIPTVDRARRRERIVLTGERPSPISPPPGCAFAGRCRFVHERCRSERPKLTRWGEIDVACHLHDDGPRLAGAPLGQ